MPQPPKTVRSEGSRQVRKASKKVMHKMIGLFVAGLTLVAALAWNEATSSLFAARGPLHFMGTYGVWGYAIVITIFAALVGLLLKNLFNVDDSSDVALTGASKAARQDIAAAVEAGVRAALTQHQAAGVGTILPVAATEAADGGNGSASNRP